MIKIKIDKTIIRLYRVLKYDTLSQFVIFSLLYFFIASVSPWGKSLIAQNIAIGLSIIFLTIIVGKKRRSWDTR